MKRWIPVLAIPLLMLSTAGACDPPPPAGWQPPTIDDLTISPDPVNAGTVFTVSAMVSDDNQVARFSLDVLDPNGREPLAVHCDLPEVDPRPLIHLEVPCAITDYALNGTWELSLTAADGEWTAGHGGASVVSRTTFEVTGGSDDITAPVLESATIDPANPVVGQPFTVTVEVSDDHLVTPPEGGALLSHQVDGPSGIYWYCELTSVQQLSPTLQASTFDCPGAPELEPGPYWLQYILGDENLNVLAARVDFDKLAAVAFPVDTDREIGAVAAP